MVEDLHSSCTLTLDKDQGGIDDFIILGQVKQPAVEGESFVPESANIGCVGKGFFKFHCTIGECPCSLVAVVSCGAAVAAWPMDLAERVGGPWYLVLAFPTRPGVFESVE